MVAYSVFILIMFLSAILCPIIFAIGQHDFNQDDHALSQDDTFFMRK